MNIHSKLPQDIIGLITPAPVSRRNFFMTASAAAAAGYTLAAGPVRAQAITTDTTGLKAGDAKVKVNGGDMPVYFARPEKAKNPPVVLVAMEIFGLHEYIKDVTRRLAKAGAFAVAPNYYFRAPDDLTKITEMPKIMPIVNAKPDAKKTAEFKIYPGAPHGFHADYRPSYRKEAAEDAWKLAIDWLKKNKVLSEGKAA